MVGQTYYELVRKAFSNDDWKTVIRKARNFGFNKIRLLLWVWDSPRNYHPKAQPFEGDHLDVIEPAYFQKMDAVISYMGSLGMIADVILLREGKGRLDFSFDEITRYIQYAMARYASYPNVIWTLVNEWEYSDFSFGKEDYWNTVGNLVKKEDPWHSNNNLLRPLSIHQATYPYFRWTSSDWPVHAIVQYGVWNGAPGKWNLFNETNPRFSQGDQWGSFSILGNLPLGIPVVNDEFGYFGQTYTAKGITVTIDRANLRRAMWAIYVSGGYGSMGDDSISLPWYGKLEHWTKRIIGRKSKPPKVWLTGDWNYLPVYEDVRNMVSFWLSKPIPYWEMTPSKQTVSRGERVYVSAMEGKEYVVYSAEAAPFELSLPLGPYTLEWFDPVTGAYQYDRITAGKNPIRFSPPFQEDAVLHLVSPE
jgi:hypothetical protein